MTFFECDAVRIHILVEGWIDILLPDAPHVERLGLAHHFDPKGSLLQAENGFSLYIELESKGKTSVILFDAGLSPHVIRHNLAAMRLDPGRIDQIALSHGHQDHLGGLRAVLEMIGRPVPVITHEDAFIPRYIVHGSGVVTSYYNAALLHDPLEEAGARFVLSKTATPLGPGAVTTGEIARTVDFEGPATTTEGAGHDAGIFQVRDGQLVADEVWDELGIAVNVKDKGLVVITGCGHAGVINTVRQSQKVTGVEKVAAVLGGFHLGFPGVLDETRERTVDALVELNPELVVPMHCSGFPAIAAVAARMPDQFVQYSVGTTITIGRGL